MRLLHISDLHAGRTLFKVSRNQDLLYALNQIVELCRDAKPHVVLIAGDIFDKANPDNESKEIIFEFFLQLRELTHATVAVSGNHDSYDFMKSIKPLAKLAKVYIYDRPDKYNFLFSLGELSVACLPYPSERIISSADEESKRSYAEQVGDFLNYLAYKSEGAKFKVLLSHLFVAGAAYTRTEREASVSSHYAVEPVQLPVDFHYIALGHVHRHQRIEGAGTQAYYTGSLFQLDFSEEGQSKFVNLVELKEGELARVEPVELSLKNPLHLRVVEQGSVEAIVARMERIEGLLKLVVEVKDKAGLNIFSQRLKEALGDKLIKVEYLIQDRREVQREKITGRSLDLTELYGKFYEREHNAKLPEEVEREFSRLLSAAEHNLSD